MSGRFRDVLLVTMSIDVTVIKSKCQFLFRLFYTGGLFEAINDEKVENLPWRIPRLGNLAFPNNTYE